LDPILCIASRALAGFTGAGHRWWLRPLRAPGHARVPGPYPRARTFVARAGGHLEARTLSTADRYRGPSPQLADRSRPARAGQGRQEVQPLAARGGPEGPDQADPGPGPRRVDRLPRPPGGL